uniref:Reverse transcriptase domain-containing protein n=1 Tax=Tanacetum cinerariifolium TaxID=118510 RepID=A0A6L2LMD0_TANCI|nr:hypothetical protein [Tanacetum cinerariifolium]
MNLLSINICGSKKRRKRFWIKDLCFKHNINFLGVQESKMTRLELFRLRSMWGNYSFDYACSMAKGLSGGIISMWDPTVFSKENIWCNDNYVIVQGKWLNISHSYFMVNIYGPQDPPAKATLWSSLLSFAQRHQGRYVLFGDLNEVRDEHERFETNISRSEVQVFNKFVVDSGMLEMMMDRLWSDHSLILLHTLKTDYGLIPFKFFHSWFHRNDIDVVVKQEFVDTPQEATVNRKKKATTLFQDIDHKIDSSMASDSEKETRLQLLHGIHNIDRMESMDLFQKDRIKWDIVGDENTKFFHFLIKQNRRRQSIQEIMVDGTWLSNRLSEAESNELERRISSDEIKKAVWDCGSDKAPGPDGFIFQFLKRYWDLFKDDIELFVYDFFLLPLDYLQALIRHSLLLSLRVSNNDKVDELGKVGESIKEKVKEGIDCVNDGIYKSADVSGGMEKHNDQECGDMDMRMNKGVFGTGDNDKEQEVCDDNAEMDSASKGSEEVKTGNPEPSIECPINVNDKPNCDELNKDKSYASKLASGLNDNNELFFIPTGMKENGEKVFVFDEELVKEDGMCYFKFKNEEGMNYVIDQSPWLVNGKPHLVQKWDQNTIIIKEAPGKIPIWIRLFNIPLEAWSVRRISALASRLGRLIKMDQVTAKMCKAGVERIGYARVLIEINVEDEFVDKIKINYVDEMRKRCDVKPKPKPAVNNSRITNDGNLNGNANQEGFVEVRNRKNFNTNKKMWNNANRAMEKKDKENREEEDVYEIDDQATKSFIADEVMGIGCGIGVDSVEEKVQICAILEIHLKSKSIGKACEYVFGKWRWVFNVVHSPTSCRIVVVWNADEVDVMVVQSCSQTILCLVEVIQTKIKLFVSFVYASNFYIDRRELRNELSMHKTIVYNKAWALMRDFNVTLKHEEHSNKDSSMSMGMNEFKDAVNMMEVEDLCSTGFQFTWAKSLKNPMCNTLKKLDRIMIYDSFIQMFEKANGVFLPYLIYDHSPAIMSIPRGIIKKKKSFSCHMYKVVQRLKHLKKPLNKLNWQNGNLFVKANSLKEKLKELQSKMDDDPSNLTKRQNAVELVNEYTTVAEDELKLLHQKAIIQWLKEGDKNSAYFHNILKARKNKSRIESICCEDGSRVEGNLVNGQFVENFQKFSGTTLPVSSMNSMGDIVKQKHSEAKALDMIKEVSDKEIKEALFDIDSSKAAGPNGYTSCFFKKAWGIIGNDICLAIREFFITRRILREINATLIALVPKIDTPNTVSDFRPIACCNVLYKCISKILTNIINEGLSKVVSLNQSAFIPGRHIQDNILITQEILKGYNRRSGTKRCAMIIDIQKAHDTVSWEFLKEVMLMVGFHRKMVHWIMTRKGLKKGYPISPYLFTLVIEVFNMIMIKNLSENGKFKYHYGCKELKLTHLCFADDLMFLCNGETESLKLVKRSLDEFSRVSGPIKWYQSQVVTKTVLSYVGRIQLIASMLSTTQQHWASVYMLSISVVNGLEKLFKRFLWNPGVKWASTVKLKGKSIWEVEIDNSNSHRWKELIRIRDKIKPYIKFRIGNGRSISVWHDKWCDLGPLDRFIHNRDIYDVRMSNEDCLADAILNGRWKWADEWGNSFPEICQIDMPILTQK